MHNGAAVILVQTSFVKLLLDWQQEVTFVVCSYTICFANDKHHFIMPLERNVQSCASASRQMVCCKCKCYRPQRKDGKWTGVSMRSNVGASASRDCAGLAAAQVTLLLTDMMQHT